MVKALVTGATGFVGSHLARLLVAEGHSVRVLHRTTSRLDALNGLEYESVIGDILDTDALKKASTGCDWVFHVAAVADYWRADKTRMMQANVEGTRRVLAAARETGVARVVFTSSAAAVGLHPSGLPADESIPFNASPQRFPYGYSKVLAEQVVAEAVSQGQDVVTVNPTVVMGPGDLNMISGSFITQIKQLQWLTPVTSGGLAVIDVRDVARGHLAAAERGKIGRRYLLNTANYAYHTWFDMIADTIGVTRPFIHLPNALPPLVALGIDLLRRFGVNTVIDSTQARMSTHKVFFDATRAHTELGEPQITMRQSLHDTYRWYLEHGYIRSTASEQTIAYLGRLISL